MKQMRKVLAFVLATAMLAGVCSFSVAASPQTKIQDDAYFMSIFNQAGATTLTGTDGEKAAVALPSNAHYNDFASLGFWFIWANDLGIDAKQKDGCYAVLESKFFDNYKSLTIVAKSSDTYENFTITQPGTYRIDKWLLTNAAKGEAGGHQNINWIGLNLVDKGIIQLVKMVQDVNGNKTAWDSTNPAYIQDNKNIWFDLYDGATVIDSRHVADGVITFTGLVVGKEYTIKERFADAGLAKKYVPINPITVSAWEEGTVEFPAFTQITPDPATGTVKQRDLMISNAFDRDLKAYDCYDNYNNYFVSKTAGSKVNLDEAGTLWYNSILGATEPVVPFWKDNMAKYNGSLADDFFKILSNMWLDCKKTIGPEFIWNTSSFTDSDKGLNGDTVIFEKTITPLDNIDGATTLYVTGDNAFLAFVNGVCVGVSDAVVNHDSFIGAPLSAETLNRAIGSRDNDHIATNGDVKTWERVYNFDITLIPGQANKITIVGVNEAAFDPVDLYCGDPMANPGGFIFGCEVNSHTDKLTFVNEQKAPEYVFVPYFYYGTIVHDASLIDQNNHALQAVHSAHAAALAAAGYQIRAGIELVNGPNAAYDAQTSGYLEKSIYDANVAQYGAFWDEWGQKYQDVFEANKY